MKRFYIQSNIGKAKYVVNWCNGIDKHNDGSDFYAIAIFKNKKNLAKFVAGLISNGFKEQSGFNP